MDKVLIEPLLDRVVLDPIKEERTEGGIFRPETVQGRELRKAKIVAVGPGKFDIETRSYITPTLKVGDVVFVNPMLGHALRVARNVEYMIQKEDDILGKVPTNL